jgi:ATP-dependent helicase/nuclease subunit A
MRTSTAGLDYEKTSAFKITGKPAKDAVEQIILDGGSDETESQIIASRILELVRLGANYADIAILARSGTHFGVLSRVLNAAGIPYIMDKKERAEDLYEIALLNNFLIAAWDTGYELPRVLTQSSFVFDFTPDDLARIKLKQIDDKLKARLAVFDAVMTRYNGLCKTMCVVDVLTTFIAEFNIINKLLVTPGGGARVKNIYTFLNKLRGANFAGTVAQYVYMLKNEMLDIEIDVSSAGESVKIMTIHSSKGLEFPIVFLFNAGASFSSEDKRKLLMVDKAVGLCVYSTDPDESVKHLSIARLGSLIASTRAQIAEEMRLLYVALTRAKDKLVIVGRGDVQKYEDRALDDFEIMQSKTYLDFIRPRDSIPFDEIKIIKPDKSVRVLAARPNPEIVNVLRGTFA